MASTPEEMSTSQDCPVCLEKFTSTVRKEVKCQYCQYTVCVTCVKRYMVESVEDPHCMNCRRAWNRDFIDSYLSIAFRKGQLKKHREDILLDREKARLPLLQPRVEARVQAEGIIQDISNINKRIREMEIELARERDSVYRLQRRQHRLREIAAGRLPVGTEEGSAEKKEVRQFTQKCPVEDCRGFLSSAWKCGTCQTWVCPDCLVPKGKDKDTAHTCNEDAKATAALIKKETRPCPKCGMAISKIDGCDQMWCIACQTPFSWTTGRQVFGVVHNPHYYQWLRNQNGGEAPRVAGDVPCGGLVGYYQLIRELPNDFRKEVEQIHRTTAEIIDYVLPQYPRLDEVPDNGDLGIEYTLKILDMDVWKKELWKRETKREKGLDLRGPLDLFSNVSSEVLRRMSQRMSREEFVALLEQLRALRQYVNEEFEKIGARYGHMAPKITECWRWDIHGSNRGETRDSRENHERVFIMNDDLMKKLNATQQAELRRICDYCMPLAPDSSGAKRYGIDAQNFNNLQSLHREIVRIACGERNVIITPNNVVAPAPAPATVNN
jgi:hypothetical protein